MKNKTLNQRDVGDILSELKAELKRLYKERLVSIILYGSYARGEAAKGSDIDVTVVLKGKVSPGKEIDYMLDTTTDLDLKYNTLISVYPVSEEAFRKVKSPLILNVRREGINV
ncbi:MAG: nucleotidyltransferase domain-containing protein [Deltaproteobacteria bacterium]|nr:nucleotidyltransferase domain-containing protein [Deltaproteobacteria bacterium]